MAVASWMLKNRNIASGRFARHKSENEEDIVKLDLTKDSSENVKELLLPLSQSSGISEGKRLNYLNAFVKLTLYINGNFTDIGYTTEEILCCLRVTLVNESPQIRSGGFRAIRHVLKTEDDVLQFNKLLMPYILARSLDITLKNDIERIEGMKLVRKVLMLSPSTFDISIARSLVSLANGGIEDKDRMLRACLAALSELGVLNSQLFILSGGVAAITRNLLECQTPQIAESLCGVLLLLLDQPATRNHAAVDLHCVAAPYCDFHYRHGWMDKNRDERELRFNCSRLALLTILRSWPGILHFCSPSDTSGLKAIVDVLYLNQLEVRKAVLDLLYELLGLPQPEWTDELSVALSAVDPAEPQASWRLNEGFVAAEGRHVLPHLAKTIPSITDMHLSLLLYCFLECGLLSALAEVIATSDTFISVRATVLLGELLRLIQILLPPECCNISPAIPNLLEYAATNKPQALGAITALQQLHKLMKRRPASYSLYLDFILQCGCFIKTSNKVEQTRKFKMSYSKFKLQQLVLRDGEDVLKETGVFLNKDAFTWNWNLIKVILKGESELKIDTAESLHKTFIKRLVEFYMPSNNRYSHMDLTNPKLTQGYTTVGVELINCLVNMQEPESTKMLLDLFVDIYNQIKAITSGKSAHDCLFSPQHMANTQCQSYFLFIGRLGSSRNGIEILSNINMFHQLQELATGTNHDCYVKLIISSLDYRDAGPARDLLSAVLICPIENSRLYATQFLLVLLRAGITNFANWGIKLLSNQLKDKSRIIRLTALSILHEACEVPICLEHLVQLNPDLLHLGEKGALLLIRFLSVSAGFNMYLKNGFVVNEIKRWDEYFNFRYVKLIEDETADSLTLHQRGEDGHYDKRCSSSRTTNRKDVYILPHLYGQLSKHSSGFQMLSEHSSVELLIRCIESGVSDTEQDILKLKSALWAIGHMGSSVRGLEWLNSRGVCASIIRLAQHSLVYAVRATAFYTLGLLGTTRVGADCLFKLGWVCTRHDRHDRWPVIEEENWLYEKSYEEPPGSDSERTSSDQPFVGDFYIPDADSSTTDDDFLCVGDSDQTLSSQQKSSTLPTNQNTSSAQHKRSLSESKTFEILKHHEQRVRNKNELKFEIDIPQRHRDNSVTESTTSGVSSCESVLGKSLVNDRVQTLSPIPSSSSLSTLRQSGVKIRRHSESSRRVSVQSVTPSDRSTVSPASSANIKLSHQDLVGYATIRSLRRQFPEEDITNVLRVYRQTRPLMPNDIENLIFENNLLSGLSLSSLSSVQKFSVNDAKSKGQCYMGICLPQNLRDLFPETQVISRHLSYQERSMLHGTLSSSSSESSMLQTDNSLNKKGRYPRHVASACLNCCRIREKKSRNSSNSNPCALSDDSNVVNNESYVKMDILKQVQHLANPVWIKPAKQALLHYKQKNPQLFQSVCLYSDVCKMVSENTYRLGPRRLLQELFLDVNFEYFYSEPKLILENNRQVVTNKIKKTPDLNVEKSSYKQLINEQRKSELSNRQNSVVVTSSANKNITRGFNIDVNTITEIRSDRFSPTKFESRSPPLSSVKEENLTSSENLVNIETINRNSAVMSTTLKTLDTLKFTYNENKFPIKKRDDPKNVIK